MAKKTDLKKSRAADPVLPKLAGLTFVILGAVGNREPEEEVRLIEAEGGRVVEEVAAGVDYLVVGRPKRGHASDAMERARRQYKSMGKSLRIVGDPEFHRLLQPTRDEAIALLAGGPEGRERWRRLTENLYHYSDSRYYPGSPEGLDLSGVDFRGMDLRGVSLECAKLEGNDFSGADLSGGRLEAAVRCKFDGATMREVVASRSRDCSFRDADLREGCVSHADSCTFDGARIAGGYFSEVCQGCSVKNVDLSDAHLNPADLSGSDFTGSKLCRVFAGYTVATGALFRDANLVGADFRKSRFERADFTGADLGNADLYECNLTGAIFRGANLAEANLRGALLRKADLREADLRGANLAEADLRGATIDGADFEKAIVFGIKLDGLDPEKARNLVRGRDRSGTSSGPRMRELAEVARSSAELKTGVSLDVPGGESARLMVFSRRGTEGQHVQARYWHFTPPDSSRSDAFDGLDFEKAMLTLVNLWPQGRLRPDGIEVEARKCPRRGAALLELATAAWREALGLPALSTEEFRRQLEARDSDRKALKEELIAELRGGPEGVAAWNARPGEKREQVGPLRHVELSGANLAGAELSHMDFTEAKLDGAHMVGADLSKSQLKGASFRGADLTDASCWTCKGTRAVFEGARLIRCNLGWAVLQRANLRDADLEAARLSAADLRGADLTGAILAGADLSGASYDDQTRWPSDFDPPAGMRWKGKGPAPTLKPGYRSPGP